MRVGAVGMLIAVVVSLAQFTFSDIFIVAIAAVSSFALLESKVNVSLLVMGAATVGVLAKLLV